MCVCVCYTANQQYNQRRSEGDAHVPGRRLFAIVVATGENRRAFWGPSEDYTARLGVCQRPPRRRHVRAEPDRHAGVPG